MVDIADGQVSLLKFDWDLFPKFFEQKARAIFSVWCAQRMHHTALNSKQRQRHVELGLKCSRKGMFSDVHSIPCTRKSK